MGLFGFGRKKHRQDEAAESAEADEKVEDAAKAGAEETAEAEKPEPVAPGEGERGENQGPWDVDDENVPDYDDYLDIGSLYLPFLPGIELRLKANRQSGQVLGATITLGDSSLEMEAFAAPKSFGLWDDVRSDLLEANKGAREVDGTFGKELTLPVKVGDKTLDTRIVGVDGPRWMLRGIFSGPAAKGGEEKKTLDKYFADVVVERGEEPLAPRDMIPMHAPVSPAERRKLAEAEAAKEQEKKTEIPGKPDGPLTPVHQVEQQTTLQRGPLFSEMR
ncbi:DUF3710 domain-containing protein [Bifidobacterium simiarum]|uniref:DUF3710 domain-containing protein n=1 Tax=Bifidobacterium simiarum TaxID=2045441 RepID=A0A2M9HEJ3_9BIFI|nr:DUF3710 domain-containing protein [Bifidobacterium simiarum]MBT1165699.1 DUF3710 domain-containing protein [Bifidobacterium simiarum]PJM75221.1 hypothetical protein CSQ87_06440 [Bifidobacterium simiarum]